MNKLLNLIGIVVLLLAIGCSKQDAAIETPLLDDDPTLKKANKFKPFHATFDVYVDLTSVITGASNVPPYPDYLYNDLVDPPVKYQFVYGDGKASHLGNSDVKLEQWWRPSFLPPRIPYYGYGVGEITFTAANGDLLLAYYTDAVSYHETPTYVEITLTGNFKDGGTGRFKNAEGSFTWEGIFDPIANFGTVTATGKIKYHK